MKKLEPSTSSSSEKEKGNKKGEFPLKRYNRQSHDDRKSWPWSRSLSPNRKKDFHGLAFDTNI